MKSNYLFCFVKQRILFHRHICLLLFQKHRGGGYRHSNRNICALFIPGIWIDAETAGLLPADLSDPGGTEYAKAVFTRLLLGCRNLGNRAGTLLLAHIL